MIVKNVAKLHNRSAVFTVSRKIHQRQPDEKILLL